MTLAEDFEGFLRRKFNGLGEVRSEYELGEDVPDSPAQSWAPPTGRVGTAARRKGPRIPPRATLPPFDGVCPKCGETVRVAKTIRHENDETIGGPYLALDRHHPVGMAPKRGTHAINSDGYAFQTDHLAGEWDVHRCAK